MFFQVPEQQADQPIRAVAQVLGIRTTRADGVEVPPDELQKMAMSAIASLKDKADHSTLTTDEAMADCTIRVTIVGNHDAEGQHPTASGHRANKRLAANQGGSLLPHKKIKDGAGTGSRSSSSEDSDAEASVRIIKAHSPILATASPYFRRAFASGFRGTVEKVISIELPGEEAFEDFQRLIDLSYRPTFTKDADGQTFGADVLVRLILIADYFKYTSCVKECVDALKIDLSYEDAVMLFHHPLPEPILKSAMMAELIVKAGDAVATGLSPVSDLFSQCDVFTADDETPEPGELLKLKDTAKTLSAAALEAALRSEKLAVGSESEAWWLLMAWLEHSGLGSDEAQDIFNRLLPSLRLAHFHQEFLVDVVMTSPYVEACPDHLRVLAAGLRHRGAAANALLVSGLFNPSRHAPRNRGKQPGTSVWSLRGAFELAACKELPVGRGMVRVIGLADGFPVHVRLERRREATNGYDSLGIFFGFTLHAMVGVEGQPNVAMPFQARFSVGGVSGGSNEWLAVDNRSRWYCYGWADAFRLPFDQIMAEGSRFVTDGEVRIEVTMTLAASPAI